MADYKGCAVLIYSGDQAFLDYYRAMFVSLGLAPVTATTPEAAMAILRMMIVAYVVIDAEGGLKRCRQVMLRAHKTQHHAPLLVVCRKSDPDFRHQAMTMGAAECIEHPMPPDHMAHALLPSHAQAGTSFH